MVQSLLVIISSAPYGGSDAAWNAIRLAATAREKGGQTRIFLINAGVDAARNGLNPPEGYFNLAAMLAEEAAAGAEIRYCKTCIDRCGIGTGEMIGAVRPGSMQILHDWITDSDKVVTF